MGRRLIAYVSVRDADGTSHRFAPGDEAPEWAASYLSNPDVWDDSSQVSSAETVQAQTPEPVPEPAPAATAPAVQAPEQAPVGTPPPRGGKGSGRTAWVRYAEANGLDTDEFDDRDELIAELRRRGIPVD
jgi:hypothetical protein